MVRARYRVPATRPTLNGHHDALQQKNDFKHRREATPHHRDGGTPWTKDTTTTPDANLVDEHTKTLSADCVTRRHPLSNVSRTVFLSAVIENHLQRMCTSRSRETQGRTEDKTKHTLNKT